MGFVLGPSCSAATRRVRASSPRHPPVCHLSVAPYFIVTRPLMLGVDVGGTFTDVVAVRDGRIRSPRCRRAGATRRGRCSRARRRLGVEGSAVFNHASTVGLNAIITRRLPKIAFLTTEGLRDILDHGADLATARGADRRRLAPPVRRRCAAAGPALPAPRASPSGSSPTAAC